MQFNTWSWNFSFLHLVDQINYTLPKEKVGNTLHFCLEENLCMAIEPVQSLLFLHATCP